MVQIGWKNSILRPTIAETTRDLLPGRTVHVWQMKNREADAASESLEPEWLNLPLTMSQFADKSFAQYQLQVKEAEKKHHDGKLNGKKLQAAKDNCVRPLVLTQQGRPAGGKYIKSHVIRGPNNTYSLKEKVVSMPLHFVLKVLYIYITKFDVKMFLASFWGYLYIYIYLLFEPLSAPPFLHLLYV